MRITVALLLVVSLLSCEAQHNRKVLYSVKSIGFSPATTQTADGNPIQTTGPITGTYFSIKYNYEIELGGDGDFIEDPIINSNPIDTFQIWSSQTFAGKTPYSLLNTLFAIRHHANSIDPITENGPLDIRPYFNIGVEPYQQVGYLISTNATITPGSYDLYIRCKFHDGTVVNDSLVNIDIQ